MASNNIPGAPNTPVIYKIKNLLGQTLRLLVPGRGVFEEYPSEGLVKASWADSGRIDFCSTSSEQGSTERGPARFSVRTTCLSVLEGIPDNIEFETMYIVSEDAARAIRLLHRRAELDYNLSAVQRGFHHADTLTLMNLVCAWKCFYFPDEPRGDVFEGLRSCTEDMVTDPLRRGDPLGWG